MFTAIFLHISQPNYHANDTSWSQKAVFLQPDGFKFVEFKSDSLSNLPPWSRLEMFSIISLTGIVWKSADTGYFECQSIWAICVFTPTHSERVNYVTTKTLNFNSQYSSFRPQYMSKSQTIDVKAMDEIWKLLNNPLILSLARTFVEKPLQSEQKIDIQEVLNVSPMNTQQDALHRLPVPEFFKEKEEEKPKANNWLERSGKKPRNKRIRRRLVFSSDSDEL